MQNKNLVNFFLVVFIATLFSCNSELAEPDDARLGFVFFPLAEGEFREYNVERINYLITGEIDTIRYKLKEAVADSFLNEANSYTYVIHRFISTENEWKLDSVWTARKNNHKAIMVENNMPFVKLVFPIKEKVTWDGNSMNALETENYMMQNVYQPFLINDKAYDNTITVIQKDNQDTIIFLEQRKEIYAKNIGLIYKESAEIKYCAQVHCIGKGQVENGFKLKQTLINNGKN